jgi:predicted LPLAT superfamily acyltransferase
MAKLVTTSQFANPDAAYLALVEARRNLSDAEAAELDTRLVLILANHVGDLEVLREAIALAKRG